MLLINPLITELRTLADISFWGPILFTNTKKGDLQELVAESVAL